MENKLLTCSENMVSEYCASVVRIGELRPIEGSDFLVQTYINGCSIVIRKDEVKEGDVLLYAPIETQLCHEFLSVNNMYELHEFELNENATEVAKLKIEADTLLAKHNRMLAEANTGSTETPNAYDGEFLRQSEEKLSEAKSKCGYFTHTRRIRMINLRKVPSMGFLFHLDSLAKWKPEVANINLEELVGSDFDTVCGELFIKVYVPNVQESRGHGRRRDKSVKSKQFEMLNPGNYTIHYETQQLGKSIGRFTPSTEVVISTKIHGSLGQYAHIIVNRPHDFGMKWFNKLYRFLVPDKWQLKDSQYEYVYGSHKQIKNADINPQAAANGGFYGIDIWSKYNELLAPYIPEGMVVYGEIFGYVNGTDSGIQGEYDYKCNKGENKYMPYRIYVNQPDGTKKEWEVTDVHDWTVKLMEEHPELKEHLFPLDILYKGTLQDLYPELDPENHWWEEFLIKIQNDKRFFMEMKEPLCKNKVPREGVVIRITNDPIAEAFKQKTVKFRDWEEKKVDAGLVDMEMADNYVGEDA